MPSPIQPVRVLVIDDDPIMRELLDALLSVEGYSVLMAASGEIALTQLQTGDTPAVILTDMQLPGLSGVELAAQLHSTAPDAILVGMSGSEPTLTTRDAFDAFLLKPFSPEDFSAAILAAHESQLPGLGSNSASDSAAPPPLDEATCAQLAASLPAAQLAELYQLTLEDVAQRLTRMRNALAEGNLDMFRREAHALKGGCSMVGAREIAILAGQAEFTAGTVAAGTTLASIDAALVQLRGILSIRFMQNR